ncbi:APC family permease [Microbacterium sp. 77mftsu3.1]|uniref:APC family permease n=1 Tax=Microbacterium sp. 77mftsu3.1 TaxID=1761802 RepID=UPI0003A880D1|nr:APC family permease [Microbacterium sp. 77mftsu3.1]SDG27268.1 amino acid/polyamine/organocation transporter, APC superfamily [Microbacterium sp. 77mftsu3.1]
MFSSVRYAHAVSSPALARRLGLADAVVIGLGAMIGAGVFAAFVPAAQAAGTGLLVGLGIAALVAFGNATSTAQLAAVHPTSGGVYAYGRAELGPWWGFIAGWGFVIGKTASCAAMALTFAAYVAPAGWERPVAAGAALALGAVNLFGITRTAQVARILVTIVLLALGVTAVAGFASPPAQTAATASGWFGQGWFASGPLGILQAAGLLFFAFAGYARIATLGEEVRDPARTIPRAIVLAFCGALVVYAVIGVAALRVLGPDGLAAATAPLVDVVRAAGWDAAAPIVRVGAAAASLGALLALIAGIGRTSFAMAREGDLPRLLAAVDPRWHVPRNAEIAVVAVVVVIVMLGDVHGAIGFSSFGVLTYYLVANIGAFRQRGGARRYPRILQVLGGAGCVALVVTLPWPSVPVGIAVLVVGLGYRMLRLRRRAA